jgi:hypothetical protein
MKIAKRAETRVNIHAKCSFIVLFHTVKVRQNVVKLSAKFIESRWGRDFPQLSRPALRPAASNTMSTGSFPGVKWPGRGVDHPPHLAPRLKEK